MFFSCGGHLNTNALCREKFKKAKALTYTYPAPTRQSALDSALFLTNECLQCDNSIRKAAVDLKITLLFAMKKYPEGILFVDSLSDTDFDYQYQKKLKSKTFEALKYNSKGDTTNLNLIYAQMSNDLEQYIKMTKLSDKEFNDIYIELYAIREKFLDTNQINKEVEILESRYPEKKAFFEFFKK